MSDDALHAAKPVFFIERSLRMKWLRQAHIYLGFFIAPSLLLFAITGALQLFGMHEARPGYQPPALIEKLAQVHIHQQFALRPPRTAAVGTAPRSEAAPTSPMRAERMAPASEAALKWAFLVIAVSIVVSTFLGLWMGLTRKKDRTTGWIVLLAGAGLPVLILALLAGA
jgi:hypothetical protein